MFEISAKEARSQSDNASSSGFLERIYREIDKASRHGNTEVEIESYHPLSECHLTHLDNNGFEVHVIPDDTQPTIRYEIKW